MALAEQRPTQSRRGPECDTCRVLRTLPPAEAAALEAMLGSGRWRYAQIADALHSEHGERIGKEQIARHARGECLARRRYRGEGVQDASPQDWAPSQPQDAR